MYETENKIHIYSIHFYRL